MPTMTITLNDIIAGLIALGALAAVVCAVSDALSHRGGDIHAFPATPERVLKGLGVLPAGEPR